MTVSAGGYEGALRMLINLI